MTYVGVSGAELGLERLEERRVAHIVPLASHGLCGIGHHLAGLLIPEN